MFPDLWQPLRLFPALTALCLLPVPLYAGQLITTPSLSLSELYNDNIFSSISGRRADYLTTVSPGLALSESNENISATLAGGVSELLYLRNSASDGLGYFVRGSGGYTLSPKLVLNADLGGTRDTSASYIDPATSLVIRSQTLHQNYRVGESYRVSELVSSSLSLGYGRDDYDNTAYLSTRHYLGSAEVDYDLGRRFPGTRLAQVLSVTRDATDLSRVDSLGVTLGMSRDINELWHLSLNAGGRYTRSRYRVAGSPVWGSHDEGGPLGSLVLAYAHERLSGSLTLSQDLTAASGQSGATQRTLVALSLSEKFTPRLSGSLGAGYSRNWSGAEQYGVAIDERLRNLGGSLRYEFFDAPSDLALVLNYTYNSTDYPILGAQMNQNVIMVQLSWQHPRSW